MMYGTRRAPTTETIYAPRDIQENTKARREWLAAKCAELIAAGREAKVCGVGCMQYVSVKIAKAKATRMQLRGLCQCCGRQQAVMNGVIAHHGYLRPEAGWQTPSCIGARFAPLSESCEQTGKMVERLGHMIATTERAAADLEAGATPSITITVRRRLAPGRHRSETVVVTRETADQYVEGYNRIGTTGWAVLVGRERARLFAQRDDLQSMKADREQIVAAWHRGEYVDTTKEYEVEA